MRFVWILVGLLLAPQIAWAGTILDGKGRGFQAAVNKENQLEVKAITQSELEHESEENGAAYSWATDAINLAADETLLLVENNSDTGLHLESVTISASTTSEYTIHLPTTDVVVAGTTVTGTNMNTASSNVADATAASNETGNSQGNIIYSPFVLADTPLTINLDGFILGKNKSIAVDQVANTTLAAVTIIGHYED